MIKTQQEEAQWRMDAESASKLMSQIWKIRYARAVDVAQILQGDSASLLSERGHLSVDARTNMIFVRDTHERLAVINRLITRMDIPVKQVLIEARLVSMDQDAERQLGIDFSVRQPDAGTGKQALNSSPVTSGHYSIAVAKLPDGSWPAGFSL